MPFEARGYVSFDTALSAHGVLDDMIHAVRIATAGDDRIAHVDELGLVEWISLPDDLLYGYRAGTALDFPELFVAEPEKAFCDLVWLCEARGFAVPLEALRLELLRPRELSQHALRMGIDLGNFGL